MKIKTLQKTIGVTYKCAQRMRVLIKKAFKEEGRTVESGGVGGAQNVTAVDESQRLNESESHLGSR